MDGSQTHVDSSSHSKRALQTLQTAIQHMRESSQDPTRDPTLHAQREIQREISFQIQREIEHLRASLQSELNAHRQDIKRFFHVQELAISEKLAKLSVEEKGHQSALTQLQADVAQLNVESISQSISLLTEQVGDLKQQQQSNILDRRQQQQLENQEVPAEQSQRQLENQPTLEIEINPHQTLEKASTKLESVVEQVVSRKMALSIAEGEYSYPLIESIWDSMLILGITGRTIEAYLSTCTILLLNCAVQLVCLWKVLQILNYEVYSEDVREWKQWREVDAHSSKFFNELLDQSLAQRVCSFDDSLSVASVQIQALLHHKAYSAGAIPSGVLISSASVFIWCATISAEIRSALSFGVACWSRRGVHTTLVAEAGGLRIASISTARSYSMLLVMLARMSIAGGLLVAGSLWLSRTPGISDMLLNTTALGFIIELDEVFFAAFAPLALKALARNVQPLPLPTRSVCLAARKHVLILVGSLIICFYFLVQEQIPLYKNLETIREILCGGKRNFIVHSQPVTSLVYLTNTSASTDANTPGVAQLAVRGVLEATSKNSSWPLSKSQIAMFYENIAYFQSEAYLSMPDLGGYWDTCFDTKATWKTQIMTTLRLQTGIDAFSCAGFESMCGSPEMFLLRLMCPQTCQCTQPQGGLFLDGPFYGCPRDACRETTHVLQASEAISCEDLTPENLRQSDGWKKYWTGFQDFYSSVFQTVEFLGVNDALKLGCAIVPQVLVDVCRDHSRHASLAGFCPVSCGCKNSSSPPCPPSCK